MREHETASPTQKNVIFLTCLLFRFTFSTSPVEVAQVLSHLM